MNRVILNGCLPAQEVIPLKRGKVPLDIMDGSSTIAGIQSIKRPKRALYNAFSIHCTTQVNAK